MLTVPTERPVRVGPEQTVPPGGEHEATVASATEDGSSLRVTWRFRAEGRSWTIKNEVGAALAGILLTDWGYAPGEQIEAGDLRGRKATIGVVTWGGRSRATVETVRATG